MNVEKLTQAEFDMLQGFKFAKNLSFNNEEYDKRCNDIAVKMITILFGYTEIEFPNEIQDEIDQDKKIIMDNDLKFILKENDLKPVHISGVITKEQLEDAADNLLSDQDMIQTTLQKIQDIERELESVTDSNEKRSLKMRLNHLNKKLKDNF